MDKPHIQVIRDSKGRLWWACNRGKHAWDKQSNAYGWIDGAGSTVKNAWDDYVRAINGLDSDPNIDPELAEWEI